MNMVDLRISTSLRARGSASSRLLSVSNILASLSSKLSLAVSLSYVTTSNTRKRYAQNSSVHCRCCCSSSPSHSTTFSEARLCERFIDVKAILPSTRAHSHGCQCKRGLESTNPYSVALEGRNRVEPSPYHVHSQTPTPQMQNQPHEPVGIMQTLITDRPGTS